MLSKTSYGLASESYQAGRLDEAEAGFRQVLAAHPRHAGAVYFLGAVAFRVFSFWLPALIAVLSVATMHGLRSRLREVARARDHSDLATEPPVAEPRRPE